MIKKGMCPIDLAKILTDRHKEFQELKKIGIVTTEYTDQDKSVVAVQVDLEIFDTIGKGLPFSAEYRGSENYPYKVTFSLSGVDYYVILSERDYKLRFWE